MGNSLIKNTEIGASLVAQWLRVCMPMQGTRVRALVWEDPTCRGATKPVHHNYWACASGACAPQREAATVRGPRTAMKSGPCLPQLEKALAQKWRPNTAKKKKGKYHLIPRMCKVLKWMQMNVFPKPKQTHRHRKHTYGYQRGKVVGRGKLGVWD